MRRDLLLRHDRTVHAKDGGVPLHSEVKRRSNKTAALSKPSIAIETATIEQLEGTDALVDMDARAAMLITELHQAAVGAILDQEQEALLEEEKSRRSVSSSSDGYDNTVQYSSSAPVWDPPTPSSAHDSCHETWNGSLQPPRLQLPSMDRSFSSDPSHAPSLRSGLLSSAHTPGTYSPYPYTNPPSPLSYGGHSSLAQAAPPPPPPQVESDDERNIILDNIREMDVERAVLDKFRLPSRNALNRYLSAYFSLYHHHLPFLHPASFSPSTVAPPLLLAVLSIGALYTFEKEQA